MTAKHRAALHIEQRSRKSLCLVKRKSLLCLINWINFAPQPLFAQLPVNCSLEVS
jgi:hypothetical protein